ncbi:hypothetical protein SAR116_1125 [Candidatus Puniceispirillum marinum IMCC1322]|uniref:Uncharacterized protein n=1 Tax=Puniceispirillum marinum (strain IMCC1322) TaxID=488538 RepID=D5BSX2_PUNMI|nr:hypothetical protein SAR116_1125 [Candidatus Puniceispirillum marinum IMCC1322]
MALQKIRPLSDNPTLSDQRVHNTPQFDVEVYLPNQTEIDRALRYPYYAPSCAFVLDAGRLHPLRDAGILNGRTAVLSVGSNRAPVQLQRKFGKDAVVPVTPAILHDCDIVHVAMLGYYGAVPCTAFPSKGCDVRLNVAWLDASQLAEMHRTEAVGVAYDYVRFNEGAVTHLDIPEADGHVVPAITPLYGYNARAGVLDIGGAMPASLPMIDATGRQFSAFTQAEATTFVRRLCQHNDDRDHAAFVTDMRNDKAARDTIREILSAHALFATNAPWTVIDIECDNLDAFL